MNNKSNERRNHEALTKYLTPKGDKTRGDPKFMKSTNILYSTDTKNQSSHYRSTNRDSE